MKAEKPDEDENSRDQQVRNLAHAAINGLGSHKDLLDDYDKLSQWLAEWAAMDGGRFVNFETHHRPVY